MCIKHTLEIFTSYPRIEQILYTPDKMNRNFFSFRVFLQSTTLSIPIIHMNAFELLDLAFTLTFAQQSLNQVLEMISGIY